MKLTFSLVVLLLVLTFTSNLEAQKRRISRKTAPPNQIAAQKSFENANTAVVVDERLAVLRPEPSLFAKPLQRMRRGRIIQIGGAKEADGIKFYRVGAAANNFGWVQSDAVVAKNRRGEDERLARLVQSSSGFDQIERATIFLETFPVSPLRPPILLLLGDVLEEVALKLSSDATKRLDRREMAASGAPLHSFYLNYVSLDRYRRLGIGFVFNSSTKLFHYDGAGWREIVSKYPKSAEAVEAQKRLNALNEKMEKK